MRINMKKIIAIVITFMLFSVYVNYTSANDCDFVIPTTDWNFAAVENWKYETILPKAAITQAMINLKGFCCDSNSFKSNAEKTNCTTDSEINQEGLYPSSAYLYDHILDVSMRRLDAKVENENWADLIYGLDPDETWKNWREFITKQANSKDWSIPLLISTKFKESREAGINSLVAWTSNKGKDNMPWWNKEFENYEERNLSDKYKWVCETSVYLYLNLPLDTDSLNLAKLYTAYWKCETISNERVQKEFNYTKAVLMQKWNKLLHNNIKSYLDTYFSQNKLVSLQQLVFNIKNTFNEVNKAVLELVSPCS